MVDYFISKFEAIPEEKWCVGSMVDCEGRRCALGHCYGLVGHDGLAYELARILEPHGIHPAKLNDGQDHRFQQDTPKSRILAALKKIKKGEL